MEGRQARLVDPRPGLAELGQDLGLLGKAAGVGVVDIVIVGRESEEAGRVRLDSRPQPGHIHAQLAGPARHLAGVVGDRQQEIGFRQGPGPDEGAMALDGRGRMVAQALGDPGRHLRRAAGDGEPVDVDVIAQELPAQGVDRLEVRGLGRLRPVVHRGDGQLLGVGVHGRPHARDAQDLLMDVGLRGGLVVAIVGLGGREEADLAGVEVAFLAARGRDQDLLAAGLVLDLDGHVAAVAVLDVVEEAGPPQRLEHPQGLPARRPGPMAHGFLPGRGAISSSSTRAGFGRPASSQPRTA